MFYECLSVGLGGFIGSVLRYLLGFLPIKESTTFPINTFIINILGAILISFIAFYITNNNLYNINPTTLKNIILFLKVGVCGGFTTFSTFALETGDLIRNGNIEIAFLYVLLSVVVGVTVIFLPELLFDTQPI
ncbi:MAG: fluoride efflux transporter CrcB [Methanosphaera stadtmanae]|jgi:CrcB protein|nr:fluoride efflux transporter CrcB [Methanosphaera stadtmanae]